MKTLNPKKFCKTCTSEKDLNFFAIRAASSDGRAASCKVCIAERNKTKYWVDPMTRQKSIQRAVDAKRERYIRDPAYKRACILWSSTQKRSKVPPWVKIVDFVPICRRAITKGAAYEIDHIIPLKGKLVCGLHVPNNIRVVLKSTNQKKSNRFDQKSNL